MHADSLLITAPILTVAADSIGAMPADADLDGFFDLSRKIHRCTSYDELCATLAACIHHILSNGTCAVFVMAGMQAELRGVSGGDEPQPVLSRLERITALDKRAVEELVGSGSLLLPQIEVITPAMRDLLDLGVLPPEPGSFYAFALRSAEQLLGIVAYATVQSFDLSSRSLRIVEALFEEAALVFNHLDVREELRQHAEALERTRALVDATNDAIVLLNDQGQATLINRRAKFFFGLDEEDVLGKDYAQLQETFGTIFEAPQQFANWLAPLMTSGRERAVREFQTLRPTPRLLQCFTAPVRTYPSVPEDIAPKVLGRLLVFRDITREREVDQMKNDFVSTVSHELRTPLTSIRGALQLVLGQRTSFRERNAARDHDATTLPPRHSNADLSPRARDLLDVSLSNTERLIRLINDILDIAKIEHGSIPLQREPLDPVALCRTAQAEVEGFAGVRGIRVLLNVPDHLPPVYADHDRTGQVLTNLLSNAIKFSSEGQQVLLSVSADAAPNMIRFAVRDWGRGIASQDQQRIFQRFQQLDSSTTRDVGGTGLGLAICKSLVSEHGGTIWVESVPAEGSTFFFTLPLAKEDATPLDETHDQQTRNETVARGSEQQAALLQPVDSERVQQNYARFVHLFSSPLTTLEGAIAMLRHRSALGKDSLSQTLLDAAGRSLERIKHTAELLQSHATYNDESVSIRLPQSDLGGPHQQADHHPSEETPVLSVQTSQDNAAMDGVSLASATAVQRESEQLASLASPQGLVLLVAKDAHAMPLVALLEQDGHQLLCATGAAESIDTARHSRPDLIVLDLDLPATQDAYIVQVLREDPETKTIPMLYLANNPEHLKRLPSQAAVLAKTADPALLRRNVQQAIAAGRATDSHMKTILIVDDEADIRQLLMQALDSEGYRTVEVGSGTEALLRAQQQPFDLIILDLMLPDLDGFAVLGGLRARAQTALTPIILLSALNAPQEKVQGLQLGADDYVTKPFEPAELCARVRAAMRRSELEGSANPSTRLPGNIAIERVISRRIEQGLPFAVCYCDLDNFKAYNDAYGFLKGDAVIHQTAHVLVAAVERSGNADDFVGHIGGDDFVVVTTPDRLDAVCADTLHSFDTLAPLFYDAPTRARRYIESVDRKGQPAHYPLVSLSIAVVTNTRTPIHHLAEVAERAIDLKKQAKQREGSVYVVDEVV